MILDLGTQQHYRAVASLLVVLSLSLTACQSGEVGRATASGLAPTTAAIRATPTSGPAANRPSTAGSPSLAGDDRLPGTDPASPVTLVWQADGGLDRLRLPTGLAVDRHGVVTVVDAGNDRIVRLTSDGQVAVRWGGEASGWGQLRFTATPEFGGSVDATFGGFGGGVAVDAEGALYVTELLDPRVRRLDQTGRVVAAWATTGDTIAPAGIAVDDRHGAVYIADRLGHRVLKFDRDGRRLLAWGEVGRAAGQFISPAAVAVDRQGQVYVADFGNHRIQKFDDGGRFLTAWGGPGNQIGEFTAPVGVAIGPAGHVYVADAGHVQVFTDTGLIVGAWRNASGNGGEFILAGIAVNDQGAIYVTDQAGYRVLKFRPRRPWPTPVAAQPAPRPTVTTPTPTPVAPESAPTFMTPTDR